MIVGRCTGQIERGEREVWHYVLVRDGLRLAVCMGEKGNLTEFRHSNEVEKGTICGNCDNRIRDAGREKKPKERPAEAQKRRRVLFFPQNKFDDFERELFEPGEPERE